MCVCVSVLWTISVGIYYYILLMKLKDNLGKLVVNCLMSGIDGWITGVISMHYARRHSDSYSHGSVIFMVFN